MFAQLALLLLRLQIGYLFWIAGYEKWTQDPPFTDGQTLNQFLNSCLSRHESGSVSAAIVQNYFLAYSHILAWVVVLGELSVGAALVSGTAVRLACALGMLMNISFMIAQGGSFLTFDNNAFFILVQLALMAAAAGRFLGVDYFLNKKCPNKYLW